MARRTGWTARPPRQWSRFQDSWRPAARPRRPGEECRESIFAWGRSYHGYGFTVAGTDRARITYQVVDAFLQPVREPGGGRGRVLRPLRRQAARRRRAAQPQQGPSVRNQFTDGLDSLLHSRRGLDRIHHRPGLGPVPAEPGGSLPCVPGALSVRVLAHGGLSTAAACLARTE